MLRRPQVFIGKVPDHAIPNLISIVQQHGGSITDDAVEASHIVDWDEEVDSLPSEPTEEFVRTLEVRPSEDNGKSLVHWYYHPDSYDEWIPSDHVDGSEPPDTVPQSSELNIDRQWHVCCRFVMDCEVFNEWGNEIDYESIPEGEGDDDETNDETAERSPVKTAAGRKARGRRRLDAVKAKKVPILESVTITEKMMQDVPPPLYDPGLDTVTVIDMQVGNECELTAVKHGSQGLKSNQQEPIEISVTVEGNTQGVLIATTSTTVTTGISSADAGIKRKAEEIDEGHRQIPTADIPKSAPIAVKQKKDRSSSRKVSSQSQLKLPGWYNSELLNALEIKHLPDFFATEADRAKNTVGYFRIRNFIVSLYAHNPSIYLSATDCRRKLSGDVCAVLRVHAFLDAFGVINFNAKAEFRPILAQASLSHWHEDLVKVTAPDILFSSSKDLSIRLSDNSTEDYDVEWSESMDLSLRRLAVKSKGDWIAVAAALTMEYNDSSYGDSILWAPTAEECLTHFVSLSIPNPLLKGNLSEGTSVLALAGVSVGVVAQQMRFLSSQLSSAGLVIIGRTATQEAVSAAVHSLSNKARIFLSLIRNSRLLLFNLCRMLKSQFFSLFTAAPREILL